MPTVRTRKSHLRLFGIIGAIGKLRATRFLINARCPGNFYIRFGGEQFAGLAVKDIEKAILWSLHDDFARLPVDVQVGKNQVLRRCVIPPVARCRLIVPDIFARVWIESNDGGEEKIVAALRAATGATRDSLDWMPVVREAFNRSR